MRLFTALFLCFMIWLGSAQAEETIKPSDETVQTDSKIPQDWDINDTANVDKPDTIDNDIPPWERKDIPIAKEPEGSDDCRMPPWMRKPGLKCD